VSVCMVSHMGGGTSNEPTEPTEPVKLSPDEIIKQLAAYNNNWSNFMDAFKHGSDFDFSAPGTPVDDFVSVIHFVYTLDGKTDDTVPYLKMWNYQVSVLRDQYIAFKQIDEGNKKPRHADFVKYFTKALPIRLAAIGVVGNALIHLQDDDSAAATDAATARLETIEAYVRGNNNTPPDIVVAEPTPIVERHMDISIRTEPGKDGGDPAIVVGSVEINFKTGYSAMYHVALDTFTTAYAKLRDVEYGSEELGFRDSEDSCTVCLRKDKEGWTFYEDPFESADGDVYTTKDMAKLYDELVYDAETLKSSLVKDAETLKSSTM
jgi:hypothetical protein